MRIWNSISPFLVLACSLPILDFPLFDVLLVIFFDMLEDMIENLIVIEGRLFDEHLTFSADAVAG